MKIFMAVLTVLVAAGARGATPALAEGFEGAAVGTSVTNGLGFRAEGGSVAVGDEEEEGSVVRTHNPFAYSAACGEPDAFKGRANARYLHYHTNAGEGRIWRSVGDLYGATNGCLFVDVLVQLDVWSAGSAPATDMAPGQRFQFWAEADDEAAATNLCIAALQYDDDGWDTYVTTNVFRMAVRADFSSNAWHRLTLKLIDDVTRAHARNPEWYPEGVQGFQVWFDGQPVQAEGEGSFTDAYVEFLAFEEDPTWGWLVAGDPVDEAVAELLQSGTVFADLRGAGAGGLCDVGFKGTGGADDITVTTSEPAGMRSVLFDAVLLDEADAAFAGASAVGIGDWLAATGKTAAEVAGVPNAHASYLLGLEPGLEEDPTMAITRIEPAGVGLWDVTVRVAARAAGKPAAEAVELHDGTRTTFNGELVVQSAAELDGLASAEPKAYPLVFEADRTELTVRVDAEAGSFFRARIR